MAFCLPKFAADALLQKMKSGEITPDKLSKMSSEQRREVFSFLGEEAAVKTNALFESKLLLKNQQQGMITWTKQILGTKSPQYKDMLAKVNRLKEVLSETQLKEFKQDLIKQRLGVKVTKEQAQTLVNMAKEIDVAKAALPKEFNTMTQDKFFKQQTPEQVSARMDYGIKTELFKRYAESLNPRAQDLRLGDFNPIHPIKTLVNIGAVAKSLKASLDNSFWLNQGIPALFNPRLAPMWLKNFGKSFPDLAQGLLGKDTTLLTKAEIASRPDAVNGTYARQKAALGLRTEEAFPTSIPEKIPVFGRAFKASSQAYTNAALRMRVDILDYHNALARKQGVDLTNPVHAEAIGQIANATSGRGSLGTAEASLNAWNNVMFSPRLLMSTFDTLTAHMRSKKVRASPFARKQAAKQLLSMVATYYAVMALFEATDPGSVEFDPRGAHFGQKKIDDNTWVNIIGPYRPLVRALATLVPTPDPRNPTDLTKLGFYRKTSSGRWTGHTLFPAKSQAYGAYTPLDVAEGFIEGKASPLLSTIMNFWRGEDFSGEPTSLEGQARNLLVPISVDSYITDSTSNNSEESDNAVRNAVISAFGGGVTTY